MPWWGSHLPKGSNSSGPLSSIWSSDMLALAGRGAGSSLNQATQGLQNRQNEMDRGYCRN